MLLILIGMLYTIINKDVMLIIIGMQKLSKVYYGKDVDINWAVKGCQGLVRQLHKYIQLSIVVVL